MPERFDGASEMPELMIGTPAGVFSIFEFEDRIEDTLEFQSIAAGFFGMRAVVFFAVFIVFSLGFECGRNVVHMTQEYRPLGLCQPYNRQPAAENKLGADRTHGK